MADLRLVIDAPTANLWDSNQRRAMYFGHRSVKSLKWRYRPSQGGAWDGKAKIHCPAGTPMYERMVEEGAAGLAWIYWNRAADIDDLDDRWDLLWMGMAEDPKVSREGDELELKLRGAGRWLKDYDFTGEFSSVTIRDAVTTVLQDLIDRGDTPITSLAVENDGILQRRVSVKFDRKSVDRVLKKLAELAGGPSMVSWGVRPSSSAATYAEAYFGLWSGHLWEKDSNVQTEVWGIGRSRLIGFDVDGQSSDIVNEVEVVGAEIEQDEEVTDRLYYSGLARSSDSIQRFGLRRDVIEDSSLRTAGQCAMVAAGKVKATCSRRIDAQIKAREPLAGFNQGGDTNEKPEGLLQTALRNGQRLLVVRDQTRPYRSWGDTRHVYAAIRHASNPSALRFDLTSAPKALDTAVVSDLLAGVTSVSQRLYVLKGKILSTTKSFAGLNVLELDRWFAVIWKETSSGSGLWYLEVLYRNTSNNWVFLATGGTTKTTAELQAEHTVALVVEDGGGSFIGVQTYFCDGINPAVSMCPWTAILQTSLSTTGTQDRLYLNAAGSTGVDAISVPGDCPSSQYASIEVYREWGNGSVMSFLDLHANEPAPFKLYGDLVLHANFAIHKNPANPATRTWVRYAYGQADRPGGYDAIPIGLSTNSFISPDGTCTPRGYSWLLGTQRNPAAYGTHLEILPVSVDCEWLGPHADIDLRIKGTGATRAVSVAAEELAGRIKEMNENQRNQSRNA